MTVKVEFQLATASIATLTNKSLKKNLTAMLKAVEAGRKSVWDYAEAIANIIADESYKDDFESQKAFAESLDLSNSSITQYCKAVKYVTECGLQKPYQITIGKAYMMGILDEETRSLVFESLEMMDLDINHMSDKVLKNLIDSIKKTKKSEEDEVLHGEVEETSSDDRPEATDESKSDVAPSKCNNDFLTYLDDEEKNLIVISGNAKFSIPWDVLELYKVEEL